MSNNTYRTRHVPPITPFAEGVYAIVSQSQRSHLVYQITYPEIGEVQKEFGLHKRGSYIVSARNPKFPGPSNLPLRHPPMYSESIQKKFRGLRWIPLTPELLDYNNTQLLLIGEGLGVMRKEEDSGSDDQGGGMSVEGEIEKLVIEVSLSIIQIEVYLNTHRTALRILKITIPYLRNWI